MKIDVKKVAQLANLPLTDVESEKFQKQLSAVLDYINKLNQLDTSDVKETSQVTGLENVASEDETKPSLSQEEALSGTKNSLNGRFKVKGILNE